MCIEKTTVQAVTDLSDVDVFLFFFSKWIQEHGFKNLVWIQERKIEFITW